MKLSLPLFVILPRKTKADKKFILNLNVYRTTHYQVIAQAKVLYKEKVREALYDAVDRTKFGSDKVRVTYILFPASNRRIDIQNVCPIVSKFAEDSLVCLGVLDDDSADIIVEVVYRMGRVDKENPRCELTIERTFDEL
jgi:hypothetical protein